ncbi:hypothetical protein [Microbacterium sp. No. 7]|uniref:hypothetical protein n=1 Tax=Microbacterium sp. No. 7 TaxID=1714373 RepID=UPI0006D24EBC|nr:hypothetical protein [Microbacterium sp. No. 7]ALJ20373.1 hypothetical protein AOA12_10810 [Microbacterium sp. No. 7]
MLNTDHPRVAGHVAWVLTRADGTTETGEADNLVTLMGLRRYAEAGADIGGVPPAATGMKLGTGSTAPATTGAGAALATYLSNSHQALAGTPSASTVSGKRRITYVATWGAGKATTGSAITEVVIVNNSLSDATSPEASTLARVLLSPSVPSKGALDTLQVTWTHDLG